MGNTERKKWQLLFKGNIDDFDNDIAVRYWSGKTCAEKFAETRSLIDQALAMKGKKYDDVSGFLRTTAVLKRA